VLARHLDGDVGHAGDQASPAPSADHLQDCAACRQALARARRLDAALAEIAGRDLHAAEVLGSVDRLLAAAAQLHTTASTVPQPPRRRGTAAALALVLLAATVLVAPWPVPIANTAVDAAAAPAAIAANDIATNDIATNNAARVAAAGEPAAAADAPIPTPGLRRLPAATRPSGLHLPHCGGDIEALASLLGGASADASAAAVRHFGCDQEPMGGDEYLALQQQAGRLLLDSGQAGALRAWVQAIAQLAPSTLLVEQLQDGRRRPPLLQQLRSELAGIDQARDLFAIATVVAAARLGTAELDAALLRLLRKDRSALEPLAVALRGGGGRPGAACFLLEAWRQLADHGRGGDDDDMARSLFGGGGPQLAAELTGLLARRLQPAERVRCFLALGSIGDPDSRSVLLRGLRLPAQPEALAAAWALAQLPAAALDDLGARARRNADDWLLRAALTAAGCAAAEHWLPDLAVSREEREWLRGAGRSLPRFVAAAALLRERPGAGD